MIGYYRKIGLVMYRLRRWLGALSVLSALTTIVLLFADPTTSQRFLLPSLILTLWLLLFLSLAYFSLGISMDGSPRTGLRARIARAGRRLLSYVLAVVFTLVFFALLYISSLAVRVLSHQGA